MSRERAKENNLSSKINLIIKNGFTILESDSKHIKEIKKRLMKELGMRVSCIQLKHGLLRIERTFNDLR